MMEDDRVKGDTAVWILRSNDKRPDEIRESLMAAALRVWPRAEAYALREMNNSTLAGDTSVIWGIWEESLESALKSLKRKFRLRPVRDTDAYVFGIFCHRLKRRLAKEKRIEFVPSNAELVDLKAAQDWAWPAHLENGMVVQKAIAEMDDWMKEVLFQRVIDGASWQDVARDNGISEKAAMKRFLYRLNKIRERLSETEKSSVKHS